MADPRDITALCAGIAPASIAVQSDHDIGAVELVLTVSGCHASYVLTPTHALDLACRLLGAVVRLSELGHHPWRLP